MNRLTEKDDQGNWHLKGVRWEQLHEGQVITGELLEKLYGALWKLMEYEDTGVDPEEVEELLNFEKTDSYRLLEKLNAEERKNRWIPVTERLPKDEQEVWVSTKTGSVCLAMYHESYGICERSVFLLSFGILQVDDVTAWQPSNSPAPYTPVPEQDNPSGGWQEQMASTFLGDSRL